MRGVLPIVVLLLMAGGCAQNGALRPETHLHLVTLPPSAPTGYGSTYAYEHVLRADLYESRGETWLAIQELEKAVNRDPDYLLRVKLARLFVQVEQYTASRRQLAQAIRRTPAVAEAWVALADLYRAMGQDAAALEAAEFGVRVDPSSTQALIWLAGYHLETRPVYALSYCQRALLQLENVETLALCAEAANSAKNASLGLSYLSRYVRAGGAEIDALAQLAQLRFDNGDPGAGIAMMESLVEQRPTDDALRGRLIGMLLAQGQGKRVVPQVVALGPCEEDGVVRRAGWLVQANEPWEARTYLVDRVGENPSSPASRLQLAALEASLGRLEMASLLLKLPEGEWPPELEERVRALRRTLGETITSGHALQ